MLHHCTRRLGDSEYFCLHFFRSIFVLNQIWILKSHHRQCVHTLCVGDAFLDKINDSNIRVCEWWSMESDRENVIAMHTWNEWNVDYDEESRGLKRRGNGITQRAIDDGVIRFENCIHQKTIQIDDIFLHRILFFADFSRRLKYGEFNFIAVNRVEHWSSCGIRIAWVSYNIKGWDGHESTN